ncbi:hypothetical protein [Daejeonella sp.]|uniref:rolling circle replication-associated protein n=1 Tax=Daejeonella sp. TaxID=2805397 RepID=UPI00272FBF29|nr:hypothetical protein [Daejeonella sp.]MDP2415746.1 hypothetical protein [Daejeonella sp.]
MRTSNTYGRTFVTDYDSTLEPVQEKFTGSSLCRKKQNNCHKNEKLTVMQVRKRQLEREINLPKEIQLKSMSPRTKQKIKDKLIAFSRQCTNLTFVTLTFANNVDDLTAVKILRKFIDNTKKRTVNFQYLWVAERQTKNQTFKNNIHFHLVTNKSWDINKYWVYWLELQKKNGVKPTNPDYKPSSAFNVMKIKQNDLRKLQNYLTKYISKNNDTFLCQVWNCSKMVSALYTHYSGGEVFLDNAYKLDGENIKEYYTDYGTLHFIPLNQKSIRLYNRLDAKNKELSSSIS